MPKSAQFAASGAFVPDLQRSTLKDRFEAEVSRQTLLIETRFGVTFRALVTTPQDPSGTIVIAGGRNGDPEQVAGWSVPDFPERALGDAATRAGFSSIVIDYLPIEERNAARTLARSEGIRRADLRLRARGDCLAVAIVEALRTVAREQAANVGSSRVGYLGHSVGGFLLAVAGRDQPWFGPMVVASASASSEALYGVQARACELHVLPGVTELLPDMAALYAELRCNGLQFQIGDHDDQFDPGDLMSVASRVQQIRTDPVEIVRRPMGHGADLDRAADFLRAHLDHAPNGETNSAVIVPVRPRPKRSGPPHEASSNGWPLPLNQSYLGALVDASALTRDPERLKECFDDKGVLLLRRVLPEDSVQAVGSRYLSLVDAPAPLPAPSHGVSGHAAHQIVREKVFDRLCRAQELQSLADALLGRPSRLLKRRPFRHFKPGSAVATRAHADWSYLDRGSTEVITFWVPISECGLHDAPLVYLENSGAFDVQDLRRELAGRTDRPSNAAVITNDLRALSDLTGRRWLWAGTRPGDVIVHSPRIIHASLDCGEGAGRMSADLRFVPQDSASDPRWDNHWSADDGY